MNNEEAKSFGTQLYRFLRSLKEFRYAEEKLYSKVRKANKGFPYPLLRFDGTIRDKDNVYNDEIYVRIIGQYCLVWEKGTDIEYIAMVAFLKEIDYLEIEEESKEDEKWLEEKHERNEW